VPQRFAAHAAQPLHRLGRFGHRGVVQDIGQVEQAAAMEGERRQHDPRDLRHPRAAGQVEVHLVEQDRPHLALDQQADAGARLRLAAFAPREVQHPVGLQQRLGAERFQDALAGEEGVVGAGPGEAVQRHGFDGVVALDFHPGAGQRVLDGVQRAGAGVADAALDIVQRREGDAGRLGEFALLGVDDRPAGADLGRRYQIGNPVLTPPAGSG
jgi:hypothetical protein